MGGNLKPILALNVKNIRDQASGHILVSGVTVTNVSTAVTAVFLKMTMNITIMVILMETMTAGKIFLSVLLVFVHLLTGMTVAMVHVFQKHGSKMVKMIARMDQM